MAFFAANASQLNPGLQYPENNKENPKPQEAQLQWAILIWKEIQQVRTTALKSVQ